VRTLQRGGWCCCCCPRWSWSLVWARAAQCSKARGRASRD